MRRFIAFSTALLCAQVALAGVKIRVNEEGLQEIYNETPSQHARRVARNLVPVPEARLNDLIRQYAEESNLDPKLVRAVMQVESGYNAAARSAKGAMGLMQLMPETANDYEIADPYDPEQNVRGGTAYLRSMLDRFDGNLEYALAGYNAGPESVTQYDGIPPYAETRAYIERVLRLVNGEAAFHRSGQSRSGRKTYVTRDADGRLLITTAPPSTAR